MVKLLKNHKAAGEDGIAAELLKSAPPALISRLCKLFQRIWSEERVPQDWQDAILAPLFKKGDKTDCGNYRGISIIDVSAKVFMMILLRRIRDERDRRTRPNQAGFRPGRGCVDQIFALRRVIEHRHRYQQATHVCFIDFKAAFDSVNREKLWEVMRRDGVNGKLIRLLRAYYENTRARVRVYGELSDFFTIKTGVRQGCAMSPVLFNFVIDWILNVALEDHPGVRIGPGAAITDLDYADDIAVLAESRSSLLSSVRRITETAARAGMQVNVKKTKVMSTVANANEPAASAVEIRGEELEDVDHFKYLGSVIMSNGQSKREVEARIRAARTAFSQFSKVLWRRKEIALPVKVKVYRSTVRAILLYSCEALCVRKEDLRKLEVFDHSCLRWITRTRWHHMKTNDTIRSECNLERISTVLLERRLQWVGHVLRRPATHILSQAVHTEPLRGWKQRRGGQMKTWLDTVKADVTGMSGPAVYGVKKWNTCWRKLVADVAQDRQTWKNSTRDVIEQAKSETMGAG